MMMPLRGALSPLGRGLGAAELAYLLYDAFTTDRAAGAVNGTSAEPTGGTRTVVDTNNKLSITGGQLSFAAGGVGGTDPRLTYSSLSRTAGKVFTTNVVANGNLYAGFSTSTVATLNGPDYLFSSNGTIIYSHGGSTTNLGVSVAGTSYQLSIILRSTGAYYYIKGGIYTNWTLLWVDNSST